MLGALFRQSSRIGQKRELVILLKTTVVQGGGDWARDVLQSRDRIRKLQGDDADGEASSPENAFGRP